MRNLKVHQQECLRLLIITGSNQIVAERMKVSEKTVKRYLHSARNFYGVGTSLQAAIIWDRLQPEKATPEPLNYGLYKS